MTRLRRRDTTPANKSLVVDAGVFDNAISMWNSKSEAEKTMDQFHTFFFAQDKFPFPTTRKAFLPRVEDSTTRPQQQQQPHLALA